MSFDSQYAQYKNTFEAFLLNYIQKQESKFSGYFSEQLSEYSVLKNFDLRTHFTENYSQKIKAFYESVKYSLTGEGKRFRPVLALASAEMLGQNAQNVLPFALCMEMIHTYSLIHDDLPCMDNDDMRRGRPTNHKAFSESTALLAGDALLTEAFGVLLESKAAPINLKKVYSLVVECAGIHGMIGGQFFDLESQKAKVEFESLVQMQVNKTGALIYASMMGPALLYDASFEDQKQLARYARLLGLSFQIADDILDQDKNELGSFVAIVGLEKSKKILVNLLDEMQAALEHFQKSEFLLQLAIYNSQRLK